MLSWMLPPKEFSMGTTALSALHCNQKAHTRRHAGVFQWHKQLAASDALHCTCKTRLWLAFQ